MQIYCDKESFYVRKRFNFHGIGLGHQHGRRLIVLGHLHGRSDVYVKRLFTCITADRRCSKQNFKRVWKRKGRLGWVRCVANPIFQRRCFPSATFYNHKFYKTASANHISSFLSVSYTHLTLPTSDLV